MNDTAEIISSSGLVCRVPYNAVEAVNQLRKHRFQGVSFQKNKAETSESLKNRMKYFNKATSHTDKERGETGVRARPRESAGVGALRGCSRKKSRLK